MFDLQRNDWECEWVLSNDRRTIIFLRFSASVRRLEAMESDTFPHNLQAPQMTDKPPASNRMHDYPRDNTDKYRMMWVRHWLLVPNIYRACVGRHDLRHSCKSNSPWSTWELLSSTRWVMTYSNSCCWIFRWYSWIRWRCLAIRTEIPTKMKWKSLFVPDD